MDIPTHDSPYEDALALAVRAARKAAAVIRDRAGHRQQIRAKTTNDFVTATDEAAQQTIVETLQSAAPGDDILAEEGTDDTLPPPAADGRRWIVDPLDGTTNFVQQVSPYAVSIALQEGTRLVAGVVLEITHDEVFTAVIDHGVQRNGHPVEVGSTKNFGDAFIATGFPYRRFEHTDQYLDVLGRVLRNSRGVRRHGAASVDLAWLACGRFDGFFETGLHPWDVAAGTLLVREGGGRVTDYRNDGGLTPLFEQQVCATNGLVHEPLLNSVASMKEVRL